jgi:glucose-6-phosphate isomerase
VHGTSSDQGRIWYDYSRQQVDERVMSSLMDLAGSVNLSDKIEEMRRGQKINTTEDRAVLHHALRARLNQPGNEAIESEIKEVHLVLSRIKAFTNAVRTASHLSADASSPISNFVAIGIGGSQLGPEFVCEALRNDKDAKQNAANKVLRFLANVDPTDLSATLSDLDPKETMIIVVSKTFTTAETMLNARTAREWLLKGSSRGCFNGAPDDEVLRKHMVAVSTAVDKCKAFGIDEANVFGFWDWVGGRYSVCSAVGMLPLSLFYGYDVMEKFLEGASDVDDHFFTEPLRQNIPVLMGLLGVWNSTFMGYSVRALLPYSQALKRLPAHIQQVDMESNGKRVSAKGEVLPFEAGEVNFGEPGTNGQHSFYQLMHQGRVVPADFVGFRESQVVVEPAAGEKVSNHDELMANFFAQPDALALGKTLEDVTGEGVREDLREHKVFGGNRPSSSILMDRLDAYGVGQILALYEHRTAVQGFVWGINSFDQWGVELGKALAGEVRGALERGRRGEGGGKVAGFNSSTGWLMEAYLGK